MLYSSIYFPVWSIRVTYKRINVEARWKQNWPPTSW